MATSGNPRNTIEIVQKYQFAFQKKFGRNLLIDTHVLDKVISTAGITGDDCVLEVGPGTGTMTQYLAERAGKVVAVEIDTSLLPIPDETLKGYSNVMVINNDILKLDMNQLADEHNDGRPIKVVASLLYYVTTSIIMGLFESNVPIDSITVMVQKEMADRIRVGPGSEDCGALSLAVQYCAKPYIMANVPPSCFIPHPNAGSAVIRLTGCKKPPVQVGGLGVMFQLIRTSFNQHRKTLQNGLDNSPEVPYTEEQIVVAIESLGVPASVREGALMLERFAGLSSYFTRAAGNGV